MLAVTAFIIYVSKNSDGNKKIKKNLKNLNNALMTKYLFNVANKDIRKTNLILNRFLACEIPFHLRSSFNWHFLYRKKYFIKIFPTGKEKLTLEDDKTRINLDNFHLDFK